MGEATLMLTRTVEAARTFGRRSFIRKAGAVGVAVPLGGALFGAACSDDNSSSGSTGTAAPNGTTAAATTATATRTATAAQAHQGLSPEEIDEMHKQGVLDFLKNQETPLTEGKGNQPLAARMEGAVKVWDLTIDEIDWETKPGNIEKARGYNGVLPGPILRATVGDTVRINVKNNLEESSTIHWHGLYVPNAMDGVPYVNQDPIKPGGTFTYEFTLRNSGTHMYHSHHNALDQVNRGLLGAFIVDPVDPSTYPAYDKEYILVLNDTMLGFTINGKEFPATDALVAKKGERVLVRFMNEGLAHHPMHLHGLPMQVFAVDGWPLPQPYMCDTLDVAPGNRYDAIVEATEPGVWAFHCHVLSHAESPQGMFGMVTAMVIQE
jgi:FtsP/CotA-like multicopper oxidase with cupredoxin domain